jgi:two-component system response regulator FixJ
LDSIALIERNGSDDAGRYQWARFDLSARGGSPKKGDILTGKLIHLVQLVDDDEGVRLATSRLLKSAHYEVKAHQSGDAFLAELDRHAHEPRPSCVLLDLRMPGRSGLDIQEELQRRQIHWPVIIMTGHADVGIAIKAMKAGAFDFIEKPCDPDILLEALHQAFVKAEQALGDQERIAIAHILIKNLTDRECQVLRALLAAMSNKQIARELDLSVRTVEVYRGKVMTKLQARGLSAAVRMAIDAGLEPLPSRGRSVG